LTKNSTDENLSTLQKIFSQNKYKLKISNVKRNKKGEITQIKLSFDSGKTYNQILERKSTEPIDNIKIFINTDRELIKKWKIKRDVLIRGYNIDKVIKQINDREEDYLKYIITQKDNADIIINYFEINNVLNCKLVIQNYESKLLNELLYNNIDFIIDDSKYININIKNNFNQEICYIIKLIQNIKSKL
jgi:hypothetical protein